MRHLPREQLHPRGRIAEDHRLADLEGALDQAPEGSEDAGVRLREKDVLGGPVWWFNKGQRVDKILSKAKNVSFHPGFPGKDLEVS